MKSCEIVYSTCPRHIRAHSFSSYSFVFFSRFLVFRCAGTLLLLKGDRWRLRNLFARIVTTLGEDKWVAVHGRDIVIGNTHEEGGAPYALATLRTSGWDNALLALPGGGLAVGSKKVAFNFSQRDGFIDLSPTSGRAFKFSFFLKFGEIVKLIFFAIYGRWRLLKGGKILSRVVGSFLHAREGPFCKNKVWTFWGLFEL